MSDIKEKLEELKKDCINCTKCKLSQTRTNVVFGEGNPESPLMIIGEGPGATEDATGRPFVGRAGKLLDDALAACKMNRNHVFICNTVKCRACIIENGKAKNRPPETSEIETCSPWLLKQIEIIKPLVILSLGAPSAKFVIKKDFKMTKERGIVYPTKYAKYAIAALHPAYILRQAGQSFEEGRNLLISDIETARKQVIQAKKESEEKTLTLF
ncbi:MAG: uracil-DNA glycosylase [Armatimonadota bacterium]